MNTALFHLQLLLDADALHRFLPKAREARCAALAFLLQDAGDDVFMQSARISLGGPKGVMIPCYGLRFKGGVFRGVDGSTSRTQAEQRLARIKGWTNHQLVRPWGCAEMYGRWAQYQADPGKAGGMVATAFVHGRALLQASVMDAATPRVATTHRVRL